MTDFTNPEKTGALIKKLRIEKNLTQNALATMLNISDKTVSKWECGAGLPDISMIRRIAGIFGVNAENILSGDEKTNESDVGNMKKTNFYYCEKCGGIYTSTANGEIYCCSKKLVPLEVKETDEAHLINISQVEDEWYITMNHEMTKQHYIVFIAYLSDNEMTIKRLYAEQECAIRFKKSYGGKFYFLCSQHGLFTVKNN